MPQFRKKGKIIQSSLNYQVVNAQQTVTKLQHAVLRQFKHHKVHKSAKIPYSQGSMRQQSPSSQAPLLFPNVKCSGFLWLPHLHAITDAAIYTIDLLANNKVTN